MFSITFLSWLLRFKCGLEDRRGFQNILTVKNGNQSCTLTMHIDILFFMVVLSSPGAAGKRHKKLLRGILLTTFTDLKTQLCTLAQWSFMGHSIKFIALNCPNFVANFFSKWEQPVFDVGGEHGKAPSEIF